jgi:transposase, IS6 family
MGAAVHAAVSRGRRPCRHAQGDRWFVDEPTRRLLGSGGTCTERSTSSGRSLTFVSARRDASTAGRFFNQAVGTTKVTPAEVVTDRTATYPMALEELLPAAWHRTDRYANNRVECDHGRLTARLRPMRGLKRDHGVRMIVAGHAFIQNIRRGYYEPAVEEPTKRRLACRRLA